MHVVLLPALNGNPQRSQVRVGEPLPRRHTVPPLLNFASKIYRRNDAKDRRSTSRYCSRSPLTRELGVFFPRSANISAPIGVFVLYCGEGVYVRTINRISVLSAPPRAQAARLFASFGTFLSNKEKCVVPAKFAEKNSRKKAPRGVLFLYHAFLLILFDVVFGNGSVLITTFVTFLYAGRSDSDF